MKYSGLLSVCASGDALLKALNLIFFLFATIPVGYACAISPMVQIAENPQKYLDKYSAAFFGEIIAVDTTWGAEQLAEFRVLDSIKGRIGEKVQVVNKIITSCSLALSTAGYRYYVFGNLNKEGNQIVMEGFPAFVTEAMATESGLLNKLGIHRP